MEAIGSTFYQIAAIEALDTKQMQNSPANLLRNAYYNTFPIQEDSEIEQLFLIFT